MAQSFTAETPVAPVQNKRRRVLVTGAAGNIGSYFAEKSHQKYDLRLMVRGDEEQADVDAIKNFGEIVKGELSDLDGLKQLCDGVDTVLHLAASPSPDTKWKSALENNIVGTYNLFVAA